MANDLPDTTNVSRRRKGKKKPGVVKRKQRKSSKRQAKSLANANPAQHEQTNAANSAFGGLSQVQCQESSDNSVLREVVLPERQITSAAQQILKASPAESCREPQETAQEKLSIAHFQVGQLLGTGSYSKVFLATRHSDRKRYAMKIVEKLRVTRNKNFVYILQEKKVMNMLDHPTMIKLYWTFKNLHFVYLVSELGTGGEFWALLQQAPEKRLPLGAVQFYAAELVLMCEYLTSKGIHHRDIKPENLLLINGHLKLTDFGTAKLVQEALEDEEPFRPPPPPSNGKPGPLPPRQEASRGRRMRRNSFVGTPEYMPPEVLHNKADKGCVSDLWAVGCVVFQMLAGRVPFKADTPYLTMKKTMKGHATIDWPADMDANARLLIEALLHPKPRKRLGHPDVGGFAALKAHPFFQGLVTDKILTSPAPALSFPWYTKKW